MAYELTLPDLGEGVAEGEIARWLVEVGQDVEEDDPLVEIQTDKTTVEIPSPRAGTVSRILVAEGDLVPVGTPLVVIDGGESEPQTAEPEAPAQRPAGPVRATPLVRRIAVELGVDLAAVAPTGADGRVTEEDVRAVAASSGPAGLGGERRVPLRGVRRLVAERLDELASRGAGGDGGRGVRRHGALGGARRALLPAVPRPGCRRRGCGRSRS